MDWEHKISIDSQQKSQRDGDLKELIGTVIADKYKVIEILGRGGSGVVFHVEQTFLGTHLALKFPTFSTFGGEEAQRFQREAKATFQFHHPNLIKVLDFGVLPSKQPYLVMELVRGLSLTEFIKMHGPLSVEEATEVFTQAAAGLKFAHERGIIHRDVKPGNIMLVAGAPLGSPGFVKILDFGIAKVGEESGPALTQTGDVFGSPSYMSPEQCDGKKVDLRTDIYSLGCSFYEALVGTPPYFGASHVKTLILHQTAPIPTLQENSLGRDFPIKFEYISKKMLQKDPDERYQNLGEFIADLNAQAPQAKTSTSEILPPQRQVQRPRSPRSIPQESNTVHPNARVMKPIFFIGLAAPVLIAVALFVAAQMQRKDAPQPEKVNEAAQEVHEPRPHSFVKELDNLTVEQADKDETARSFFDKCPPIISKIITVDGEERRAFQFPESPIGLIAPVNRTLRGANFSKDAIGAVYVPPNMELNLEVGGSYPEAFKFPAVYKKIGLDEFAGMGVDPPVAMRLISREEKNIQLAEILQIASHWKKLRVLKIQTFKLTKEALDAIDNMKNLTSLVLINEKGSEANICKRKFLQRQEGLLLVDCSLDEFMAPLSQSKKLRALSFKSVGTIDEEKFKLLQLAPNLENLQITSTKLPDSIFDVLSKCPKLNGIFFEDCALNLKQLKQLLTSHSIKRISLKHDYAIDFAPSTLNDPRIVFLR